MKLYLICHGHKEIITMGDVPNSVDELLTHHAADAATLWAALSRFVHDHAKCGCSMMAEVDFYNHDWTGYRKKDNAYGIPFKGPENVFDL